MLDSRAQRCTVCQAANAGTVYNRARHWLVAVLAALAAVFQVRAEVAIYQNVFEGEMLGYAYPFDGYSYDLSVWENRFATSCNVKSGLTCFDTFLFKLSSLVRENRTSYHFTFGIMHPTVRVVRQRILH